MRSKECNDSSRDSRKGFAKNTSGSTGAGGRGQMMSKPTSRCLGLGVQPIETRGTFLYFADNLIHWTIYNVVKKSTEMSPTLHETQMGPFSTEKRVLLTL